MIRPKWPAVALDQADRRVLGLGVVLALAFVLAVVIVAAGVGLGVRVFLLASGMGG